MPTAAPPKPKPLNIRGTHVGIPRLDPGQAVIVSPAQAAGIHDAMREGRLDPAVEVILSERYGLTMLDARTGSPLDGGALAGASPEGRPNVKQGYRDSLPAQKTNVARVGSAVKTHGAKLVILSEA